MFKVERWVGNDALGKRLTDRKSIIRAHVKSKQDYFLECWT